MPTRPTRPTMGLVNKNTMGRLTQEKTTGKKNAEIGSHRTPRPSPGSCHKPTTGKKAVSKALQDLNMKNCKILVKSVTSCLLTLLRSAFQSQMA